MSSLATYELDGHIATITYNRPDSLNAVNAEMRHDLNEAFARFRDDQQAWVGIVTGAGKAFCAGADIHAGGGSTGEFAGTFWEKPTVNSFESGWEIFKPVIAAVNGYCLGYGLTLVTWCDFVIASERAEFGFPEVRLGVPAMVGAIRLPQRINWQYAMEMLLTGERIGADRAKEIGLAGWVVPHDQLMNEARLSLIDCWRRLPWRRGRAKRWRSAPRASLRSRPFDSPRPCGSWPSPPRTQRRDYGRQVREGSPGGRLAEQHPGLPPPAASLRW